MLRIKSTTNAEMTITGTAIVVPEVVSRISFAAPQSGTTIQVAQSIYESVAVYQNDGHPMNVSGFESIARYYDLAKGTNPETYDEQTILVAHEKVKAYLEGLGFVVEIFGL